MGISIKGKLSKVNGEWVSEFTHLNIKVKAPTPFKSVKLITDYIVGQLEGKDNKYAIRVDEAGVFYLSVTQPRPLIKFVATCLTKNYSEITFDQLNDWFWVED